MRDRLFLVDGKGRLKGTFSWVDGLAALRSPKKVSPPQGKPRTRKQIQVAAKWLEEQGFPDEAKALRKKYRNKKRRS